MNLSLGLRINRPDANVEKWTDITWNQQFISTLSIIAIFCSALTWLVFFLLVRSGEAGRIGSFNFLVPLIAIVISVIFLGETITTKMVFGLVLIIIGIGLVNLKIKSQRNHSNMRG